MTNGRYMGTEMFVSAAYVRIEKPFLQKKKKKKNSYSHSGEPGAEHEVIIWHADIREINSLNIYSFDRKGLM
jgi:hypothetical protein